MIKFVSAWSKSMVFTGYFGFLHQRSRSLNYYWIQFNTHNYNVCLFLWYIFWYVILVTHVFGSSWSWSYGRFTTTYAINALTLWVRVPLRRGVVDTMLCDKVCPWHAVGRWFSPVFSAIKSDRHDVTGILL